MTGEDPLDAAKFELKRFNVTKANTKELLGIHADEKPPGTLIIRQVKDGSPAAKAGLKVGDYPLAFEGRSVTRRAEFNAEVNKLASLSTVITVARKRETPLDFSTLKLPGDAERKPDCEYFIKRLRKTNYAELGVDVNVKDGFVTVDSLTNGGVAEKAGIKIGDRVLCLGNDAVREAESCKDLLILAGGAPMDVLIERPSNVVQPAPKAPSKAASAPFELTLEPASLGLGFQSLRPEIAGVPEYGVDPPPDDVQTLMDKCRDEIVAKIVVNPDEKPSKSVDLKSTDRKVAVLSNISMKPLRKVDTPKTDTPKTDTPKADTHPPPAKK